MADTQRGDFPGIKCSDCGGNGVFIKHWGPLVSPGAVGYFDEKCLIERRERYNMGREPFPLGYKLSKADTARVVK